MIFIASASGFHLFLRFFIFFTVHRIIDDTIRYQSHISIRRHDPIRIFRSELRYDSVLLTSIVFLPPTQSIIDRVPVGADGAVEIEDQSDGSIRINLIRAVDWDATPGGDSLIVIVQVWNGTFSGTGNQERYNFGVGPRSMKDEAVEWRHIKMATHRNFIWFTFSVRLECQTCQN